MFLPLPRLDDRRWSDLVEDSRALIPLHAPGWTDHNVSDPGITFAELFAWIAEMQIFQLDQVLARHRLKFLALAGIGPQPPRAARSVLRFRLPAGAPPVALPAGTECETDAGVRYRTLHELGVVAVELAELRSRGRHGERDLTDRWLRGEPFAPFGYDPRPGDAVVLALDAGLPVGVPVSLAVSTGWAPAADRPAEHHSARVAWELLVGKRRWRRLDLAAGEVADGTRALSADGRVVVTCPQAMHPVPSPGGDRFLVRARLVGGGYDAAPELRGRGRGLLPALRRGPAPAPRSARD
jgi:predicted phage baseplate assembly protein